MRRTKSLSCILAASLLVGCQAPDAAPRTAPPDSAAVDAIACVLAAFDRASIVAIGEEHRSRRCHEFLRALLQHPDLPARVDDVVVEFGNALYQPVIDRYIAGEDVPRAELQQVWRNTTQWLVWDSPLYEQWFALVRDRNRTLPPDRRLRVVLADPPVDWARVHDAAGFEPFAARSGDHMRVLETEVLARGRKALLIIGGMHGLKCDHTGDRGRPIERLVVGERLQRLHPGVLFTFWTVPVEAAMPAPSSDAPRARVVRGTDLGQQGFGVVAPTGILVRKVVDGEAQWVPLATADWPRMDMMTDALLFLPGDGAQVEPDPAIYADAQYAAELRRRAAILGAVYGFDLSSQLAELLKQ